jgi:uncharacterized membrane protein YsdA (DUF1294 family)
MKRTILGWFILANLFSFVTTFADLKLPWLPEAAASGQQERINDAGILTQSALGGAAGSYAGLLLTKRFATSAGEYLQTSLYVLMVQNAVAYIFALALARRLRYRQNYRRESDEPLSERAGPTRSADSLSGVTA